MVASAVSLFVASRCTIRNAHKTTKEGLRATTHFLRSISMLVSLVVCLVAYTNGCDWHKILFVVSMDELFNILSSSARIDKSKRKKKKHARQDDQQRDETHNDEAKAAAEPFQQTEDFPLGSASSLKSRDSTGKRDTSQTKLDQVHREQVAAFRRSMNIRTYNKHDPDTPDPMSSFSDIEAPTWWRSYNSTVNNNNKSDTASHNSSFRGIQRAILRNIEAGRWKDPLRFKCSRYLH